MPSTSKPVTAPDLYCITDAGLSAVPIAEQIQAMIDGGARLIQLRAKHLSDAELRIEAAKAVMLCRWANANLIINDRVEIAEAVEADGVHIGQGDMPPKHARQILGEDAIIGLSTHNEEQFRAALDEPINYIALGPVFGTTTKANPEPATGLDLVEKAIRLMENDYRPLVLIGGITLENLPQLQAVAPKAFFAVIGGILKHGSIDSNVRLFREHIRAGIDR